MRGWVSAVSYFISSKLPRSPGDNVRLTNEEAAWRSAQAAKWVRVLA